MYNISHPFQFISDPSSNFVTSYPSVTMNSNWTNKPADAESGLSNQSNLYRQPVNLNSGTPLSFHDNASVMGQFNVPTTISSVSPFSPITPSHLYQNNSIPAACPPNHVINNNNAQFLLSSSSALNSASHQNSTAFHNWHAFKRRSSSDEEESDEEQPPVKRCVTEDKMMAQMDRLSLHQNLETIDSNSSSSAFQSAESEVHIWEPEIDEETLDQMTTNTDSSVCIQQIEDVDDEDGDGNEANTVTDDNEKNFNKPTLHLSDEIKQMLKTDNIVTHLIRKELAKPSQALILWEPPIGYSASGLSRTTHSIQNSSSVVIEELPDNYDEDSVEMDEANEIHSSVIHDVTDDVMMDSEDMDL